MEDDGNDSVKEEESQIADDEEEDDDEEPNYSNQIACFKEGGPQVDPSTIPVAVRLNVKRNTSIDILRQKVPVPKAALPSTSLPAWRVMPLDQKIPNVLAPTGAVVLARGTLGQKLHVTKQEYSVDDPYHFERVVIGPYNSLHDPHAKSYLNKPSVRKQLLKQGLITKEGKVLCSLHQFNKYRNYLKTVYNQSLEKYINEDYIQFKNDIETVKKIEKYESDTTTHGQNFIKFERRQKAIKLLQLKREAFLKRYDAKQEAAQQRHHCYLQERLRDRMNKCLLADEKKRMRRERMCRTLTNRKMYAERLKMAVVAKDQAVQLRLEHEKKYVMDAYQQFVTEWLVAKWDFQVQRMERDSAVRDSMEKDLGDKTLKRLYRVERYRQLMLLIQARRRAKEDRLWRIVRKYFIIWRDKVRARKADLPDEKHQSLWDIKAALENTNKYMHDKTEVGTFDNFILNILKLKSTIRAQLAKEEAEAVLAANAAKTDTTEGDDNEDGDDSGENQDQSSPSDKRTVEDEEALLTSKSEADEKDKEPPPPKFTSSADLKPKSSAYASKKRSRYISKAASTRLDIKSSSKHSRNVTRVSSKLNRTSNKSLVSKSSTNKKPHVKTEETPPLAQHEPTAASLREHHTNHSKTNKQFLHF